MNVGSLLPLHARYRAEHPALVCGDVRLSYAEFAARVNRLANAFVSLGLRKGDKLGVVVPNCIELLEVYWAAIQIGVVLVPLSPLMRGSVLAALLRDADAVAGQRHGPRDRERAIRVARHSRRPLHQDRRRA